MRNKIAKNKKIAILSLLLILLLLIIATCGIAYSKYITTVRGTATAQVAKMICYMEVDSSDAEKTIINPYCIVTVKDFNQLQGNAQEITETDVQYTITVTPKQDENGNPFELPAYYWLDSNGTIIAHSTAVSGSFTHSNADTHEYKIVFLNNGEQDIRKYVEFNLNAVQAPRPE